MNSNTIGGLQKTQAVAARSRHGIIRVLPHFYLIVTILPSVDTKPLQSICNIANAPLIKRQEDVGNVTVWMFLR
jgi:hypothetical protein